MLCIDSSEGYSEWQKRTLAWIRENYGDNVKVGAGNVVDARRLPLPGRGAAPTSSRSASAAAPSASPARQKGIGRGQATALIDVCAARATEYFEETGIYVPVCSDGGIVHDYHMTLALAMGADFLMLGRYFARFDESPDQQASSIERQLYEGVLGRGLAPVPATGSATTWAATTKLSFEEGVDSYVPYAGALKDSVASSLAKVRSTMCNCGALTIPELQEKAKLTLVSSTSHRGGRRPRRAAQEPESDGGYRQRRQLPRLGSVAEPRPLRSREAHVPTYASPPGALRPRTRFERSGVFPFAAFCGGLRTFVRFTSARLANGKTF